MTTPACRIDRVLTPVARLAAAAIVLLVCVACPSPRSPRDPGAGGGGGGGDFTVTSATLFFDGPLVTEAGQPYVARLQPSTTAGVPPTSFAVEQGPAGMTIDAITGEIAWTPTAGQRGPNPIVITATVGATTERARTVVHVEALDTVARQRIAAATGGVVQVTSSDTLAAGTAIHFPPGAMAADAEIVVRVNSAPSFVPLPFFTLELQPSQVFSTPVRLDLGYTDQWLAQAGVANEAGLRIVYLNPESNAWEAVPCVPDPAGNRVIAQITHFSTFALIVEGLADLTAAAGDALRDLLDAMRGLIGASGNAIQDLWNALRSSAQPRRLLVVKGGVGVANTDRIALLIHGMFSSSANFPSLKAYAREHYDHVYFYEYPTDVAVRSNAAALAWAVLQDANKFPDGAAVDVYAHSMGGVVIRSAIEDSKAAMLMSGVHWNHVVFLGTPHRGGDTGRIQWLIRLLREVLPLRYYVSQGLTDLLPGSAFLATLRDPPGQGWTKYSAIAGLTPPDMISDDWVHVDSAIPAGDFRYADNHRVVADHSELHTLMFNNGVAAKLDQWRAPQHQGADGGREPVTVTTHVSRGPVQNGRYAWVEATASVTFADWVPLPPFVTVRASWVQGGTELSDFRWLFDDPSEYTFLSFGPGLIEFLDAQGKILRGRSAPRMLSLAAREVDVPAEIGEFPMMLEVSYLLSRPANSEPFRVEYGPFR